TAAGTTIISGNLTVNGSGAASSFDPNGHTVTVGLTLVTQGQGAVRMTHAADSLIVNSAITFGGDAGPMTDGVLVAHSHFTQAFGSFSNQSFRATGNHRTVLAAASPQQVTFFTAGAGQSQFNDLEIQTSAVTFMQNAVAAGRVILRNTVTGVNGSSGSVQVTLGEL